MVVVSQLQDSTKGTIVKPIKIPHLRATPGKITRFRVPLEFSVNSHLIRKLTAQSSKYILCSKKTKVETWTPESLASPPCIRSIRLTVPIELDVPINVESILDDPDSSLNDDHRKQIDSTVGVQTFDGSEQLYARSRGNSFYRSQMAVGDPMRARRIKRTNDNLALNQLRRDEQRINAQRMLYQKK